MTIRIGAGTFHPTDLQGNVLWLRSDMGITTVDAAVTDPNDISTANWTAVAGTTSSDTLTDTADAVPTLHYVYQATAGLQLNHASVHYAELRAGTLGFATLRGGAGDNQADVNLTTGAAQISGARAVSVTTVALPDGWWGVTLLGSSALNTLTTLMSATSLGGISYIGTGTGTIQVRNITVTQRNVSAWADQSGAGNNFPNGTAAQRPLYIEAHASYNGQPVFDFDGVDDRLDCNVAGSGAALLPAIGSWFLVTDEDAINTATTTYNEDNWFTDTATGNAGFALHNAPRIEPWKYDTGVRQNNHPSVIGTPKVLSAVCAGSNTTLLSWLNGADAKSVALGTLAGASGFAKIGANYANAQFADGRISEIIVYNRALSDSERQTVERYLGARYGITVA